MTFKDYSLPIAFAVLTVSGCSELERLGNILEQCCCWNENTDSTRWTSRDACNKDPTKWQCVPNDWCKDPRPGSSLEDAPFRVETSIWGRPDRNLRATLHLVAYGGPVSNAPPKDPTECEEQCARGGPFCLRVKFDGMEKLGEQLRQTRSLLQQRDRPQIAKKEFMAIFSQERDECERGDLQFSKGTLSNKGLECTLSAEVRIGDSALTTSINMPAVLTGSRSFKQGSTVFVFPNKGAAMRLDFDQASYQASFGGSIARVASSASAAVVSTERGCISVDYSKR